MGDVDDLPGILLFHIGGHGQVIVLLPDVPVGHQLGKILPVGPLGIGVQNGLDVLLGEFVAVGDLDALPAGVDEQGGVVRLGLFSTMMQVAMEVPKNRLSGSWMMQSMKLLSMRY